jgi:DNA ligase-1
MLAGKCTDITKLVYPLLATPKMDGIRCLMINGKAVSRKFKLIPNKHIRATLEMTCNSMQLDGEIMIEGRSFNDLSGDVRREDGRPDFYYAVFDFVTTLSEPYEQRMRNLAKLVLPACCRKILPQLIGTVEALQDYEQEQIALGYEGVMVRSPNSPYKCGRSTENEGYLLKIKRFCDDEAVIVGYEEEMENRNAATRDAFGRTERSSHKHNLVGKGTLGKLTCKIGEIEFGIGTGFDAATRIKLWKERHQLIGKTVTFKHQPSGADEKPRFPVFLHFRDNYDMSEE